MLAPLLKTVRPLTVRPDSAVVAPTVLTKLVPAIRFVVVVVSAPGPFTALAN